MRQLALALFACVAGCHGSSRVVIANDSGEDLLLEVNVSDHSDAWRFALPPRGAALLTVSPTRDSRLEATAAVGARRVSSAAGYFEQSTNDFVCYRVDADLRLAMCNPPKRY